MRTLDVPKGEQADRARCVLTKEDFLCGGVATGEKKMKCRVVILGYEKENTEEVRIDAPP